MRILAIAACVLFAGAAGAQESVPIRPDEAVLACSARAGRAIQDRHGAVARPAGRFKTTKLDAGWHVQGVYLAELDSAERQIDVACDVTSAGIDLSATLRDN